MWHLWAPRRGDGTHCWCDIFDIFNSISARVDIFNSITARVGACDSIISARVGARVGACFRHVAHVRVPAHFWNTEDSRHCRLTMPQGERNSVYIAPDRLLSH